MTIFYLDLQRHCIVSFINHDVTEWMVTYRGGSFINFVSPTMNNESASTRSFFRRSTDVSYQLWINVSRVSIIDLWWNTVDDTSTQQWKVLDTAQRRLSLVPQRRDAMWAHSVEAAALYWCGWHCVRMPVFHHSNTDNSDRPYIMIHNAIAIVKPVQRQKNAQ